MGNLSLFSGMFGSNNTISSGIDFSTWANIRSGGYRQLMKSYAVSLGADKATNRKNSTSTVSQAKNSGYTQWSTATSKDSTQTLAAVEKKAENLKSSADSLLQKGSKSVFTKKEVKDEEGNTSYEYDTDKIYKSVKSFVDSYNSLLDEASDVKSSKVNNAVNTLLQKTNANKTALEDIGITVDDDNRLVIDEEKFKGADMEKVKSLFQNTGSYGYQASAQASMVDFYAQSEATKANTYNSYGSYNYNYNTGGIYNSYF